MTDLINSISLSGSDMAGLTVLIIMCVLVLFYLLIWQDMPGKKSAGKKKGTDRYAGIKRKYAEKAYKRLAGFPATGKRIYRLRQRVRKCCPYAEDTLDRKTIEIVIRVILVSGLSAVASVVINVASGNGFSGYTLACIGLAIYVSVTETENICITRLDSLVEDCLSRYFQNVKHLYDSTNIVSQSVLYGADDLSYEMRLHAGQIYEILESSNAKDRVTEYTSNRSGNTYLRLFVNQAYEAMERGVRYSPVTHEILFLKNIETIREQMQEERYMQRWKRWRLSGFAFAALFPTFFMGFFKRWGMEFEPTLKVFYSSYGYFMQAFAILMSYTVYRIVNVAKEIVSRDAEMTSGRAERAFLKLKVVRRLTEHFTEVKALKAEEKLKNTNASVPVREFYAKMLIWAAGGVIATVFMILYVFGSQKSYLLSEIPNFDNRVSVSYTKQEEEIKAAALELIREYRKEDMDDVSDESIGAMLDEKVHVTNSTVRDAVVTLIREQVIKYQDQHWHWYDTFISLLGSLLGGICVLELSYYDSACSEEKRNEIREFELIILLEKDFATTTVFEVLQEMEMHSFFYKEKLQYALNVHSSSQERALEFLSKDSDVRFKNIIDGLKNVENVGIAAAFSETEANMKAEDREHELSERISFSRKRDALEILCYVPAFIVVGAYFIIPFLVTSLTGVTDIFKVIDGI